MRALDQVSHGVRWRGVSVVSVRLDALSSAVNTGLGDISLLVKLQQLRVLPINLCR